MPFKLIVSLSLLSLFHVLLSPALTAVVLSTDDYATNIADKRNHLLELVNEVRTGLGLTPLYIDITLNLLAQRHSQDMLDNEFFSHRNLNNQNAQQRAGKIGFLNGVGENIAYTPGFNLTQLHINLMKSRPHYANTINPDWSRVGFGVAINSTHTFLTVVFSSRDFNQYPITQGEKGEFLAKLRTKIQLKNKFLSQSPFREQLSKNIDAYLETSRNITLGSYLRQRNYEFRFLARRQFVSNSWTSELAESASTAFRNISKDPSPYQVYGVGLLINSTTIEIWIGTHR